MAFIIQCGREIARGDDAPPVTSAQEKRPNKANEDPVTRINNTDPQLLISNEERMFKANAYLMQTKQRSLLVDKRTL